MALRDYTVTRTLPFSFLKFYERLMQGDRPCILLSIDHITYGTLTRNDKRDMVTREDCPTLFEVENMKSFEDAGNVVDTMIENFETWIEDRVARGIPT